MDDAREPATPSPLEPSAGALVERTLPSGRSLRLAVRDGAEELLVLAPDGDLEVRITLSPAGPIVEVKARKLTVAAQETLALTGRSVEVAAQEGLRVHAGGDLTIRTDRELALTAKGDVRARGELIYLN